MAQKTKSPKVSILLLSNVRRCCQLNSGIKKCKKSKILISSFSFNNFSNPGLWKSLVQLFFVKPAFRLILDREVSKIILPILKYLICHFLFFYSYFLPSVFAERANGILGANLWPLWAIDNPLLKSDNGQLGTNNFFGPFDSKVRYCWRYNWLSKMLIDKLRVAVLLYTKWSKNLKKDYNLLGDVFVKKR